MSNSYYGSDAFVPKGPAQPSRGGYQSAFGGAIRDRLQRERNPYPFIPILDRTLRDPYGRLGNMRRNYYSPLTGRPPYAGLGGLAAMPPASVPPDPELPHVPGTDSWGTGVLPPLVTNPTGGLSWDVLQQRQNQNNNITGNPLLDWLKQLLGQTDSLDTINLFGGKGRGA